MLMVDVLICNMHGGSWQSHLLQLLLSSEIRYCDGQNFTQRSGCHAYWLFLSNRLSAKMMKMIVELH